MAQATKNLDLASMRLLLDHGADISAAPPGGQPHGGHTPLHIAVSKASQEAAEVLLGYKADIDCGWVGGWAGGRALEDEGVAAAVWGGGRREGEGQRTLCPNATKQSRACKQR
jgi:ankyrin repeat protein